MKQQQKQQRSDSSFQAYCFSLYIRPSSFAVGWPPVQIFAGRSKKKMQWKSRAPRPGWNVPQSAKLNRSLQTLQSDTATLRAQCTPGNCLRNVAYSDIQLAVVALNLKTSNNLDKLCEEFCIIKPTLAEYLKDESKQTLSASDKLCQIVLAAGSGLPNARLLTFVPSVTGCND